MASQKICLCCKFLRMQDKSGGFCRHGAAAGSVKPKVALDYHCEHWQDGGQQYYIRLGWIKAQEREETAA